MMIDMISCWIWWVSLEMCWISPPVWLMSRSLWGTNHGCRGAKHGSNEGRAGVTLVPSREVTWGMSKVQDGGKKELESPNLMGETIVPFWFSFEMIKWFKWMLLCLYRLYGVTLTWFNKDDVIHHGDPALNQPPKGVADDLGMAHRKLCQMHCFSHCEPSPWTLLSYLAGRAQTHACLMQWSRWRYFLFVFDQLPWSPFPHKTGEIDPRPPQPLDLHPKVAELPKPRCRST